MLRAREKGGGEMRVAPGNNSRECEGRWKE